MNPKDLLLYIAAIPTLLLALIVFGIMAPVLFIIFSMDSLKCVYHYWFVAHTDKSLWQYYKENRSDWDYD